MRALELVLLAMVLATIVAFLAGSLLPKKVNLRPLAINLATRMVFNVGKETLDIGIPAIVRLYSNRTLVIEYQGYQYKTTLPEKSIYKIKALPSIDVGPIIEIYGRLNKTELIIWVGVRLGG